MFEPLAIFQFLVLIFSVMIHEISHGYTAERLGDPTARLAGRLTLNPIRHVDPIGSVFLPLVLILTHQPFLIGWAKPVPYNPYNLREPQKGEAKIAAAGPLSNIFLALVFGLLIQWFLPFANLGADRAGMFVELFSIIVLLNLSLAFFNLVPIPPIDGSKVFHFLLPRMWRVKVEAFWARVGRLFMENYLISIVLLFLLIPYILDVILFIIGPLILFCFQLFTGLS